MASGQKLLTDSFPVRRTRSQCKSKTTTAIKSPSRLRTRDVSKRLFDDQNAIEKESQTERTLRSVTPKNYASIFTSKNVSDHESSPRFKPPRDKIQEANVLGLSPTKSVRLLTPQKSLSNNQQELQTANRNMISPTKLDCIQTPNRIFSTPRKSASTPNSDQENYLSPSKTPKRQSTELLRLVATSPPKRKKELMQRTNLFTPVALFKQDVSSYHAAKDALHSSTPSRLVSRERQVKDLQDFLEEHLTSGGNPGSLYVSGAPGTGKTACLEQLLERFKENHDFSSIFINCMTINQSRDIFEKILLALDGKKGTSIKETIKNIEKLVCKKKQMIVLVLDEMDQLSSKNQHVLYSIFDWPQLPSSNLILIGIANSLDMTDRILPRLHTCGCQPTLLHFPPYSKEQITAILEDRLRDLTSNGNCVIKPAALQFCARKIAAQTGDVRKALNTCRRAVEMVEKAVRSQQVLCPTSDDGCNPGSPRRSPRKALFQSVDIKHIMEVLHEIYGSRLVSSNACRSDVETSMPIQQKLLLCTLLLLTKHKHKGRDLTLGKLHEVYSKVCRVHKVENLASADFQSICGLVENNGLLQIKKHKEARLSKVVLKVDEDELHFVMKDRSLLAAVLQDQSVLKGIH